MPSENQDSVEIIFKEGVPYNDQILSDFFFFWIVDRSCFYFEGSLQTGFAAVQVGLTGNVIMTVNGKWILHSAEAMKIVSIAAALGCRQRRYRRISHALYLVILIGC